MIGMLNRMMRWCLCLVVLMVTPGLASAQTGQIKVKATHGAWQVNCGTPAGSKHEKCALVQSVTAEDRSGVALTVMMLKTTDGKKRMRVVAPLGVLLPTGLGLKVDKADVGQAPFLKCGKIGCIAEVVADKKLLKKLTTGKTAIFIIFQTPEAGIAIPISLKGFKAALASLK